MTNLNPISNINQVGDAAAKGIKDKKQAFEARARAVDAMNNNLVKQFVFGSAKKTEWHFEQQENHADSALGKYYQKINKVDLDGDGSFDAYVKCFWDEKGHMYEVQAGKDLSHLQHIDSDAALEAIDSRFVTSADNKTDAPAAATAPKATAEPPKEAKKLIHGNPKSIADIDKLDFYGADYTNNVSALSEMKLFDLIPKSAQQTIKSYEAELKPAETKRDAELKAAATKRDAELKAAATKRDAELKTAATKGNKEGDTNKAWADYGKAENKAWADHGKVENKAWADFGQEAKPVREQQNKLMRAEVKKLLEANQLKLTDIDLY